MKSIKRAYLSINEIYNEYLPVSKKKLRVYVKDLPYRKIGGRIYVEREAFENWLSQDECEE